MLTAEQKLTLKTYLTDNPDAIEGLAEDLAFTPPHFAHIETIINVVAEGKSARLNTVDGTRLRATLANIDNWVTHTSKSDLYAIVPQGAMAVDDVVLSAILKLLSVGDAQSVAPFKAEIMPFVTKTPASYVQALFNNADMFITEGQIADAWVS